MLCKSEWDVSQSFIERMDGQLFQKKSAANPLLDRFCSDFTALKQRRSHYIN